MENENSHSELTQLLKAQNTARQNEVFGGLSHAERAEYNGRAERIHDLGTQLQTIADADTVAAEQKSEWSRT